MLDALLRLTKAADHIGSHHLLGKLESSEPRLGGERDRVAPHLLGVGLQRAALTVGARVGAQRVLLQRLVQRTDAARLVTTRLIAVAREAQLALRSQLSALAVQRATPRTGATHDRLDLVKAVGRRLIVPVPGGRVGRQPARRTSHQRDRRRAHGRVVVGAGGIGRVPTCRAQVLLVLNVVGPVVHGTQTMNLNS